jgi:thioredoxin 1
MASELVHAFTDANFEAEVLKSNIPVLVDFWAEWCGPCRMLGPIMDELAGDLQGKVKVGKVNIDENGAVATELGIQSIPTVILFMDGEVKEFMLGAQPKAQILAKLRPHISAP